jgi:hypothetical protein
MISRSLLAGEADKPECVELLLRHPIVHFGWEFCLSFAGFTIAFDLLERFVPGYGQPFPACNYWFALWVAGLTWFFDRRKMRKRSSSRPEMDS